MQVLNVTASADPAGSGYQLFKAFERYGPVGWRYRQAARKRNWIQYPYDLPWEQVPEEWVKSDIVHLCQGYGVLERFADEYPLPRGIVIHHHGTKFRRWHRDLLPTQEGLGAVGIVSTVDLLQYSEDLEWVPAAVSVEDMLSLRAEALQDRPPSSKIRIGHAPTNRKIKDTRLFLKACDDLKQWVEPVLIEHLPWDECLKLKATCDLFYDQMQLGYGSNAVEAWAMGIPVIAGTTDGWTMQYMERNWKPLPFAVAGQGTLGKVIRKLRDPGRRAASASVGMAHVRRYHDHRAVVDRLLPIYEESLRREGR